MAYVADAELAGDDGLGPVERGRDRTRHVDERATLAAADVEHAGGRPIAFRGRAVDGEQRRPDDVAHVHEVAALLAVLVDLGWAPAEGPAHEGRDHAGVGVGQRLTR